MPQLDLLSAPHHERRLALPDAQVCLLEFLPPAEASAFFTKLLNAIPWRQDTIRIFGRTHNLPRLHQWFADSNMSYTWSGIHMTPSNWIPPLEDLRRRLHERIGVHFNTVLTNLYRDGNDTVAWHADDEPDLGKQPIIASVSLGAERDFLFRHRMRTDLKETVFLRHGSLLLMQGDTQQYWEHCLPRRKKVRDARINLTFRLVRPSAKNKNA